MNRCGWVAILIVCTSSPAILPASAGTAEQPTLSSGTQAFPGAGPELLVDGRVDQPGSAWAAAGSPNWVEIDLGQPRMITEIAVAPFIGSPGESYFYDEAWTVQYRDDQGQLQDFANVQKIMGAGTLVGPGIAVANGDPGTTSSLDGYKYYGFNFTPVATRFVRFTVTVGDRDGDSNGAELEVRQAFRVGSPVTLSGSADDAEDGEISPLINWSSNLSGFLGSGASITLSSLMVGTHTITASAQDSHGAHATSTTSVTILDNPAVSYSLTTTISGTGAGTVTSSPTGIDCGADCSEVFEEGAVVTLNASPDPNSNFTGWSGHADCADGRVTMTADLTCTATFDLLPPTTHSLSLAKGGTGTGTVSSSPAGIDCGADCSEVFEEGTVVTLNASPDPNSNFTGWSGHADCADGRVTMTADLTCTATFDLLPPTTHSLSLAKGGTGTGTVSSSPAGIDCGADCSEVFEEGTVVTLNASPDPNSNFTGWSGHADCADGRVTIAADLACTATFDLLPMKVHRLTASRDGTGSGTVLSSPNGIDCGADCSEDYEEGTLVSLQALPAEGSVFAGWNGAEDCTDGQVIMSDVRNCNAIFNSQADSGFLLTVKRSGSGAGIVLSEPPGIECGPDCTHTFGRGTSVSLTAVAEDGSVFAGWRGTNDCRDSQVTMRQSRDCEAVFESLDTSTHTLAVHLGGTGSGAVTSLPAGIECGTDCLQNYAVGTAVALTATADSGFYFAGWSGGADCSDGQVTMSIDQDCTAIFETQPANTQTLTIGLDGTGAGTVTSSPGGIDCGIDCSFNFAKGTVVTLTATAAAGSTFTGWSGPGDCRDGQVTIRQSRICTATFDDARSMFVDGFDSGTTDKWPSKKH